MRRYSFVCVAAAALLLSSSCSVQEDESTEDPGPSVGGVLPSDGTVAKPGFDAYFELGYEHYRQGRYAEGVTANLRAIEYDPGSYLAYNNLCSCYNHLQEWEKGAAACRRALELNGDFELARNNLNWALDNIESP